MAIVLVLLTTLGRPVWADNSALVPTPRDFPTNWPAQHQANLAAAKKGGVDILFLGDSITAGWDWGNGGHRLWAAEFAPRHAANFGIGYDRIQNVLWRVENGELDGIEPKVIVLLIGSNNCGNEDNGQPRNTTPQIIEGVSNLVRQIQFRLPGPNDPLRHFPPRRENRSRAGTSQGRECRHGGVGPATKSSFSISVRNFWPQMARCHAPVPGFAAPQRAGLSNLGRCP